VKVADLNTAGLIVRRLGEIKAERAALACGISSGGARCQNSSATWVNADDDEGRAAIVRVILASLDREEARLRRRANQISLTL